MENEISNKPLRAPFPWFGGKSRAADLIWSRFGDIANYVEPFAGSLAVLLSRPHSSRTETINDLDCFVANFWRAVQSAPDEVAQWADGPVNEADLHARHRWLLAQLPTHRMRMEHEADYFDAKIAGWWVWGVNAWIGSGWCSGDGPWMHDEPGTVGKLPHLGNAGQGVNRQLPHLGDAGRAGFNNLEYRRDGITFQNREGRLPDASRGYYREFTVTTPGSRDRGARRIVSGGNPPTVFYYSDDHYRSFRRIRE